MEVRFCVAEGVVIEPARLPTAGGAEITSATFVVCERVPLVAVMVSVYVPTVVYNGVATLSTEDPLVESEAGEKLAVAAAGNPVTENVTVPPNPFSGAMVAV
jgi:hypothetical protein